MRGSRAAVPKGTKSCRTQGDFRSSCLKKCKRCYGDLQEPKLRSEKAEVRPDNANLKLERADLRLERMDLSLTGQRTDWKPESKKLRLRQLI